MSEKHKTDTVVITKPETIYKLKKPPLYKVLLHNDDFTTRDFVVEILITVFHKKEQDAIQIMLHVHNNGIGLAGIYTYEVAETKVRTVEVLAHRHEFPLKLTIEPEI